jgi:hypothetical protein
MLEEVAIVDIEDIRPKIPKSQLSLLVVLLVEFFIYGPRSNPELCVCGILSILLSWMTFWLLYTVFRAK